MNKKSLKKDLKELAKIIYEISEKHGEIYIEACRCEKSEHSSAITIIGTEHIHGYYCPTDKHFLEKY